MDFREEPGRIFAMRDGTLIAEITFPEQDGVAVFDHTFVDGSLRGRGGKADICTTESGSAQWLPLASALFRPPGRGPGRRRRSAP